VQATTECRHCREVDDVRQAPGDHQVGLARVAVLDDDAARLELDTQRRELLGEAKDDPASHLRGEFRLAGDAALDQPEDARGDPVLDHAAQADRVNFAVSGHQAALLGARGGAPSGYLGRPLVAAI
jgi:hypothetical protein